MMEMAGTAQPMLWACFLVSVLGIWLLTSPLQFEYFDPMAARSAHSIMQQRGPSNCDVGGVGSHAEVGGHPDEVVLYKLYRPVSTSSSDRCARTRMPRASW